MGMLAERVDHVIGVDTHRDSHSAAVVVARTGQVLIDRTIAADAFGYKRLLRFARMHATGRRVWAIESSGSYGSGLATFLLAHDEWVVEVDRPARPARRNGAKSDELDAVRAAHEALGREHLAQPRRRGDREAIRVLLVTRRGAMRARTKAINHVKALIVTAREELRHQLRNIPTDELVHRCARLRTLPSHSDEHRATVIALRHTARRVLMLEAEANDLESELERLVKRAVPMLLDEIGVGPISAAQLYCSWSHPGRLRNDGAFAMLGGSAPIPASSGADRSLPPQPRRRPPAQLRAAHDRAHASQARPRHPRLRRPPRRRRQDTPRDQALPQTLRRPAPVPRPRSHRTQFAHRTPPTRTHPRNLLLTDIEASSRPPSGSLPANKDDESGSRRSPRLPNELQEAHSQHELARVIGRYTRTELVILDEFGCLALPEGAAELVFQVLSERHERGSLIITTNLPFGEWTKVFPDARLAKAVVDRLTHRAHIIDTGSESWRFRHGLARTTKKTT